MSAFDELYLFKSDAPEPISKIKLNTSDIIDKPPSSFYHPSK